MCSGQNMFLCNQWSSTIEQNCSGCAGVTQCSNPRILTWSKPNYYSVSSSISRLICFQPSFAGPPPTTLVWVKFDIPQACDVDGVGDDVGGNVLVLVLLPPVTVVVTVVPLDSELNVNGVLICGILWVTAWEIWFGQQTYWWCSKISGIDERQLTIVATWNSLFFE